MWTVSRRIGPKGEDSQDVAQSNKTSLLLKLHTVIFSGLKLKYRNTAMQIVGQKMQKMKKEDIIVSS